MSVTDWTAIGAVVISIVSLIVSYLQNRKLTKENLLLQEAAFYQSRSFEFESKLAEWPEVFRFFGIDIERVEKEEGITRNQITYLALSVHALHSYCKTRGEKIYDHLLSSDYRQRMFANPETRKAWKYARELFSDYIRIGIDRYLAKKILNLRRRKA